MLVSGASKPSSKVLSLVFFSISFFFFYNHSTKKRHMTDVLALWRGDELNLKCE